MMTKQIHEPCPRCMHLVVTGQLRREALQPLRGGALDPLARDGTGTCCRDCGAADTLQSLGGHPDWLPNRIAVANARQESLRMPEYPLGLVGMHVMQPSKDDEFETHHVWLNLVVPDEPCSGCGADMEAHHQGDCDTWHLDDDDDAEDEVTAPETPKTKDSTRGRKANKE